MIERKLKTGNGALLETREQKAKNSEALFGC